VFRKHLVLIDRLFNDDISAMWDDCVIGEIERMCEEEVMAYFKGLY
jgi:hypothetical protein